MAQIKQGSAGVSAKEIDISGPLAQLPTGVPAGIIGTALKGPAFVPITVGRISDFYAKFGKTDGSKFGPLAVTEWLKQAGSVTYVRVLGVGDGKKRVEDGTQAGSVASAGFVVGSQQPNSSNGALGDNPNANAGSNSVLGRTYFLGAFMSESAGSTVFSSAGIQGINSVTPSVSMAVPIIRGILMAPSGVILRLSTSKGTSATDNDAPASTLVATDANSKGDIVGAIDFTGNSAKQDFVLLLNGHKGTNSKYPNYITASFDMTSPTYFANVLNTSPYLLQEAGHCLYANWDIYPATAVLTGTGLVSTANGAQAATPPRPNSEVVAFLTTGALDRNVGNSFIPNYESFSDRYSNAKSPWVISQKFGGMSTNLFRFHALDSGANISDLYKISIENIAPSSDSVNKFGSFDVIIRSFEDRDTEQKPLESFRGVNLDPSSDRYIAKIIGDLNVFYDFDRSEPAQKLVIEGNYSSRSNLVRVEVSENVENGFVDPTALPVGFRGIDHLVTSGSSPLTSVGSLLSSQLTRVDLLKRAVTPPLPMRSNINIGSGEKVQVNPSLYWGVQFEHVTSLSTPNASTLKNESIRSFAKYFPNFSTTLQNFSVGSNTGAVDTDQLGVIDADRFCNNLFTLENLRIVTASNGLANPESWVSAEYVRTGSIFANDSAKTRSFTVDDLTQPNRKFAKFTFVMQGGFNGVNIFDKNAVEINNFAVTADMDDSDRGLSQGPNVRAYAKALDIMKNVVNVDIQLLAIPGIRHPIVTDAASEAVRERFDALYLMDIQQYDNSGDEVISNSQTHSVTNTVQVFKDRAIDNNFVAAYYPDVVVTDPNTLTNVVVPPSVVVLGALSLNDSIGHPWFAPAGFTRGALSTTLEAQVKLSKSNMDSLYDVGVNPLVAFPGNASGGLNPKGGVVVWGQKTLQAASSALDRVNVRRLLIEIRRQVREISQTIIFEPNRAATLARFSAAVTPRLQRIQAQSGLERFKVLIDSSTTTQQDIENNTIRGKIFVQPTKTIEFVSLDFVVTNNIQQL